MGILRTFLLGFWLLACGSIWAENAPEYLEQIGSGDEFLQMASRDTEDGAPPYPHLLYMIDTSESRVYFLNAHTYKLHHEFALKHQLTTLTERAFYIAHYLNDGRQFIMGSIFLYKEPNGYAFETWEGDIFPPEMLAKTHEMLAARLPAKLVFQPNSLEQERIAKRVPELTVLDNQLLQKEVYQPIKTGTARGYLRVWDGYAPISRTDILLADIAPIQLPPVAGLVASRPGSPLSHASMLARAWGIPYATIPRAYNRYVLLVDEYVELEVGKDGFTLKAVSPSLAVTGTAVVSASVPALQADLEQKTLMGLREQRRGDSVAYGAKSANLGELMHIVSPSFVVPDGFTIPFVYYRDFMKRNGLQKQVALMLAREDFRNDASVRKVALAALRARIREAPLDKAFMEQLVERVSGTFPAFNLFVRSSTNAEDLPSFSGAGLYDTVPNVTNEEQLEAAVKKVWASLWSDTAFEVRAQAGIDPLTVYPGVIVQQGIDATVAGVMVTVDPFRPREQGAVYINAKRGLGMKVVDGHALPEQVLYRKRTNSVRRISLSEEALQTVFKQGGGVEDVPAAKGKPILGMRHVLQLVRAAKQVKQHFGGEVEQDMEWLLKGDTLYLVQARPYIK